MMSFLIGLTAGIFGGLIGLGGGIVMIPLLVGLKKLSQHRAQGTSLVALVFTGIIGALTYSLHHTLDIWAAFLLAAAAIWPARCGAKYSLALPETTMKRVFGMFLVCIAVFLLMKSHIPSFPYLKTGIPNVLVLLATGAATGFVSGLLGLGGGVLMVSGMVLLAGIDQYTAQGSSLLAMVPAGAMGALTHRQMGNVETKILPGLIAGIILGTFAGGSFAHLLPELTLRFIFATVLVLMGIRMITSQKTNRPDGQ